MNCPKHEEVSAYIDDALTPADRQQFAVHLQTCPLCHGRLDELLALQQALRALPQPALGFDLAARFQPPPPRVVPRRDVRSFWFGWAAPGLAAAMSLGIGVWLGGMLIGGGAVFTPAATAVRVFDPVPPGGLCAASELCDLPKGLK